MSDAGQNRRRSRVRMLVLGGLFAGAVLAWRLSPFHTAPPLSAAERQIVGRWEGEENGWFKPLTTPLLHQLTLTEDRGYVYRRDVRGGQQTVFRGSWRATGNAVFLRSHVPFWSYLHECYRQGGLATVPEWKLLLQGDPPLLLGGGAPLERVETVE